MLGTELHICLNTYQLKHFQIVLP